ncbi:MAG TPA: transglycosylase SLT domain-containing protein [Polyangia bacterium]|nr:transglycosylase SLT domain-containing protein [Polyangia bacterium]
MASAVAFHGVSSSGAKASTPPSASVPIAQAAAASTSEGESDTPSNDCLTNTICSVKEKIRWQTPAWTPSQCRRISDAVSTSAKRYHLSPTLLLAVMINESDMNEKASRAYTRDGKVFAKDGGLMAIRCHVDAHDRCTNGDLKGMAWKDLMEPATNIELGARTLAHYRDGGAVMTKTIVKLDENGRRERVTKEVPCTHKNHGFWAHYNHGPHYIDKGYARHYPHRIAVLDHALAQVMNVPAPELSHGAITIHDPGKRERTADRPIEPRFKKLCGQILSSGSCSALALN